MKVIKRIFKIIAVISIVLLVGSIALHKYCDKPLRQLTKNDYLLPSETYRPPIVKIPFTKEKAPVSKKNLPIPKKDVKTTIIVKNPKPGAKDITIVLDKGGRVYRSKDTPKDVEIKVTEWKPTLLGLQSKWGVGVAMDIPPDLSFTLSWDTIRIWKLHFGLDLGIKLEDRRSTDIWLGTSVKYKILKNNNLFAFMGYNWVNRIPYLGVSMRF